MVSYFITYFNACFMIGLCVKFLSLFTQTVLWKFQGPRPAPAELNGILDIEVNGNRTGKAVCLIRYTIPQPPLKFCWTLPFKQIKLVNSEAMKCHYYISTLKYIPDELAIFLPGILENCSPWGISPGRYHLLQSQREKAKVIVLPVESKYAERAC